MARLLILVSVFWWAVVPISAQASLSDEREILKSMGLTVLAQKPSAVDLNLENLTVGGHARLSAYRGRYVLLNFWATWCGPCIEEIPSLDRLASRFPSEKLVVLAVSSGEDKDTVAPYLAKNPHRFTVLLDPDQSISGKYGVRALPTTYLIDPQGRVLGGKTGALYWDSPAVFSGFERLLR